MHRQWYHAEADIAPDTDAGFSSEASRGMAALYLHLLQPDRSRRWPFMRTLIRCFDSASDLLTPGAAPADPRSVKASCHCTGGSGRYRERMQSFACHRFEMHDYLQCVQ